MGKIEKRTRKSKPEKTAHAAAQVNKFSLVFSANPTTVDAKDFNENGDLVTCTHQITGKQSGLLDLSFMGLPSVPATGTKVKLPEEPVTATIRDGKVYRFEVESVEGGGMEGLLKQIGVSIPAHA